MMHFPYKLTPVATSLIQTLRGRVDMVVYRWDWRTDLPDYSLGNVGMQAVELSRHIGKHRQTVGVEVFVLEHSNSK